MGIEEELRNETGKWLEKLGKLSLKPVNEKGRWILENAKAYMSDSRYFLEKNDLIRAFESIVWAWAFVEIGKELGLLEVARS